MRLTVAVRNMLVNTLREVAEDCKGMQMGPLSAELIPGRLGLAAEVLRDLPTESLNHPVMHELKTWPEYWNAVAEGKKMFEFRRDDRPEKFMEGDFLRLREWDPRSQKYTGRSWQTRVGYCLRGPEAGVPDGYIVMSLER